MHAPALELAAVFGRAEALSAAHASTTLARTLDILHVASLIEIGCTRLVSGDERQIALARAARIPLVIGLFFLPPVPSRTSGTP